jgi:hypothetical protein
MTKISGKSKSAYKYNSSTNRATLKAWEIMGVNTLIIILDQNREKDVQTEI